MQKKKCLGRTPGNVLTSYRCARYARVGSEYCYAHDPVTEEKRLEAARQNSSNRRLEREQRERIARGLKPFADSLEGDS